MTYDVHFKFTEDFESRLCRNAKGEELPDLYKHLFISEFVERREAAVNFINLYTSEFNDQYDEALDTEEDWDKYNKAYKDFMQSYLDLANQMDIGLNALELVFDPESVDIEAQDRYLRKGKLYCYLTLREVPININ